MVDIGMLICATTGSMAFGVFAAYGVFRVAFALMRPRRQTVAVKARAEAEAI